MNVSVSTSDTLLGPKPAILLIPATIARVQLNVVGVVALVALKVTKVPLQNGPALVELSIGVGRTVSV